MARKFALGWRQVGACLILMAACGMIATTYSVIAVPLAEEFQPSRMVLMLAMTVMALVTALVSPPLGSLMDRLSMRLMTGLGVGFIVAGYFALSFTTSFLQAIIIFGLLMGPAQVLLGPMAGDSLDRVDIHFHQGQVGAAHGSILPGRREGAWTSLLVNGHEDEIGFGDPFHSIQFLASGPDFHCDMH